MISAAFKDERLALSAPIRRKRYRRRRRVYLGLTFIFVLIALASDTEQVNALTCAAHGCHGLPALPDLDWPAWLQAFGTTLALLWAVFLYASELKRREIEREFKQVDDVGLGFAELHIVLADLDRIERMLTGAGISRMSLRICLSILEWRASHIDKVFRVTSTNSQAALSGVQSVLCIQRVMLEELVNGDPRELRDAKVSDMETAFAEARKSLQKSLCTMLQDIFALEGRGTAVEYIVTRRYRSSGSQDGK